jgi:hypothetical protein
MAKAKRGLHKEISSIFDGVPLPKDYGTPGSPSAPAPQREGHDGQSEYEKRQFELPQVQQAQEEPEVSEVSKAEQPEGSPPRAVPIEKPQGNLVVKGSAWMFFENIWDQIRARVLAPKPGVDPRRQKVVAVLVPMLLVAFIVVFIKVLPGLKGSGPVGVEPAGAIAATASRSEVNWEVPELYPQTLRDPMQFGSVTQQAGTDEQGGTRGQLVLTGILHSDDHPAALIGTQIVYEGETISGATVVKINLDSVEFEMDGKRWTERVQKQ